jgi:hypothetical protein
MVDPEREAKLVAALPVRRAAFRALLSGRRSSFAEIAVAAGAHGGVDA